VLSVILLASNAFADRPVRLLTSPSIPPYAIASDNSGAVVELLKEALSLQGLSLQLGYASNRRLEQMISGRRVDGVYNLPCESDDNGIYYSMPIVDYHNIVVTRDASHLQVDRISDLAHARVVAFQNAPKYLPPEASTLARDNPQYREVADQSLQIEMLSAGHADAIILDSQIFHYYVSRTRLSHADDAHYAVHAIFPPAPRCAAFSNASLRDAVNLGLQQLHSNGEYDRILAKYLHRE
jgi:polar amino acid transport system substrate-binding protein